MSTLADLGDGDFLQRVVCIISFSEGQRSLGVKIGHMLCILLNLSSVG